jgi:cell division protein FtsN
MEQKQRFFIYDRKEMGVLLLLGVMVAIFAFTLGVHLGKRVGPQVIAHGPGDAESAPTVPDKLPNRQELTEQAKGAQQAADESLNQALHDEVARTGIKLDTPRQLALPEKTVSKNAGATTGGPAVQHTDHAPPPVRAANPTDTHAAKDADAGEETIARPAPVVVGDSVALLRPAPAGRFTLQIGSYPGFEEGRDQADSLEALGLKPHMRRAEVNGKTWYRLYVGGFNAKDAAEKAGARYVSQHLIEAYIVAKRVD